MCFHVINTSFASDVSRQSKCDGYIIHRKLAVNHCIDIDMKTHKGFFIFFVFYIWPAVSSRSLLLDKVSQTHVQGRY